ncbi:MAG: nucleotidyltransferase domain-containing protein [Ardenticatenales bacterium]|nr:nucleotidyltransferase domain-containing protein [Ardenticatenales bacterium]
MARVWLFGSSATGDARPRSDIDVAIEADSPIPDRLMLELVDALEESTVPYFVEVVDLASASDALRQAVHDRGIRWS